MRSLACCLLPSEVKPGYRLYGDASRERLAFIQKAKAIGLSLTEIRELLTLRSKGEQPCEHVVELLAQKLMAVDSQLRALEAFRAELVALQDEAAETRGVEGCVCGIIEQHNPTCSFPSLPSFPG